MLRATRQPSTQQTTASDEADQHDQRHRLVESPLGLGPRRGDLGPEAVGDGPVDVP